MHDPLTPQSLAAQPLPAIDSETISIFAHQLRTDLAALKWLMQLFEDGDVGSLTPEQTSLVKKATSATERMIALIGELLDLNKTEIDHAPQPIDLVRAIDDALFDFTEESYKRGIELIFLRPDAPLASVSFDSVKLRFIIQNLIENALKYSAADDKVFIHLEQTDPTIILSVKDTGIGIPQSEKVHVFEKYFRAPNARAKETLGTGLGLYFSKCIVERFGGKLWFESETHGTTFYLSLPVS